MTETQTNTKDKMYWLDQFKGKAQGGIFFRDKALVDFIKKCEQDTGDIVAIKLDGSSNVELIFAPKQPKVFERGLAPVKPKSFGERLSEAGKKMDSAFNSKMNLGSDKDLTRGMPA